MENTESLRRERQIIKTSAVGIVVNVLLSAFKAAVGLISGSIAIVLDAVNNLSDALSSIVTIVGMLLAGKPADAGHPFGHGRIEYLSALLVACIVIMAGVMSFVESIKKIIHPQPAEYTYVALIIIGSAIITKYFLGHYFKKVGQQEKSDSLVASGSDALFDALIAASTLISAIIMMLWNINIDGYLGLVISILIIKAGFNLAEAPANKILGNRMDSKFTEEIRKDVMSFDGVLGAYDLILHNYGPENMIGGIHIEVADTMTAIDIHELTHKIQKAIMAKYGVFMTIGIYAVNTSEDKIVQMHKEISEIADSHPGILQTHGIFIDPKNKIINLDIVVDFKIEKPVPLRDHILSDIQGLYPDYHIEIVIDRDYCE